jgi:AcrR family transcriptional regulator
MKVNTRTRLLQAAFGEIHHKGFRASSLDAILEKVGLTKGALYHHFENKSALGYAVVDEIIQPLMESQWQPLLAADDVIEAALLSISKRRERLKEQLLTYGCPFNNLIQEMSPVDEGFRSRLNGILNDWQQGVAQALTVGQQRGHVRKDIDVASAAMFIIASIEGCIGMAKAAQSPLLLEQGMHGLKQYLQHLRPENPHPIQNIPHNKPRRIL